MEKTFETRIPPAEGFPEHVFDNVFDYDSEDDTLTITQWETTPNVRQRGFICIQNVSEAIGDIAAFFNALGDKG